MNIPLIILVLAFASQWILLPYSSAVADTDRVRKIRAAHEKGRELLQKSKFTDAITAFHHMEKQCGDDRYCKGVALFYLGRCYLELAKFDDALKTLGEADDIFSRLQKDTERAKVLHVTGRVFANRTEYTRALEHYDAARKILEAPKKRDDGELFWLLTNRAKINIYLARYRKAVRDLKEAEDILKGSEEPGRLATLNERRGLMYAQQQQFDKAVQSYHASLKHYTAVGNLRGMSAVLTNLGHIDESQARYPEALAKYKRALKLTQEFDDPSSQAFAFNNLGSVHWKRGSYEDAVRMYREALKIRKGLSIDMFYGETLNNLGIVYLDYGEYGKAFQRFHQAYKIAKKIDSPAGKAWALHNMAWVLKDQGKLKDAQRFSQQAIQIAESINDRRLLATAVLRLGNLYEYYGDFDHALAQYARAARLQDEIGDRLFLSTTLAAVGNILTRQGEVASAKENFERALEIRRKIAVPLARLLCEIALFHIETHQYRKDAERPAANRKADLAAAGKYIEQAEAALDPEAGNVVMLLTYVKGKLALENDPAAATALFQTLNERAQASGSLKYAFLANVGLGLSYEKQEKWSEAESAFQEAVTYAEQIRKTLDPITRRTFLHGEEILGVKHVLPYEGLARVRLRQGKETEALEASEYTKARAFADRIAQRAPSTSFGVDGTLVDRLDKIEARIKASYARLEDCRAKGGDRSQEPKLNRKLADLASQWNAVERTIQSRYPAFHALRFPRPTGIRDSAVKDDEQVLSYEVTDDGVLIFLTRGKQVVESVFKPISRQRLDDLVRRFRGGFENITPQNAFEKLNAFDLAAGKDLYGILLADALPKLDATRPVIVVPDDSLSVVPFEMLLVTDKAVMDDTGDFPTVRGATFLADRHPVSYAHSISALSLSRTFAKQRQRQKKILVIANPIVEAPESPSSDSASVRVMESADAPDTAGTGETVIALDGPGQPNLLSAELYNELLGFTPLKETQVLADDVLKSFGDMADIYTGPDATMATFTEEIVPKIDTYDKIVFATHGYFGTELEPEIMEPILLLSLTPPRVDNLLRMSAVMNLDINADLVTLVACQTGLGKRISGEGTMGMGRAFQYAGARSVLMSLWSVDAQTSVELVTSMLHHLKNGKSKLEALGLAREEIRRSGRDHPFFWAAFVLVGEST